MRTTVITRQTLHQGTQHLAIVRSPVAYYVIHIDAAQQCTSLPDAKFWTYAAAQTRLTHEFDQRRTAHDGEM